MVSISYLAETSNRKLNVLTHGNASSTLRMEVLITNLLSAIQCGQYYDEENGSCDDNFHEEFSSKLKRTDSFSSFDEEFDEYYYKNTEPTQSLDREKTFAYENNVVEEEVEFEAESNDQEISEFSMVSYNVFGSEVEDFGCVEIVQDSEEGDATSARTTGNQKDSWNIKVNLKRKLEDDSDDILQEKEHIWKKSNLAAIATDFSNSQPENSSKDVSKYQANRLVEQPCTISQDGTSHCFQSSKSYNSNEMSEDVDEVGPNKVIIFVTGEHWADSKSRVDIKNDFGLTFSVRDTEPSSFESRTLSKKRAHLEDDDQSVYQMKENKSTVNIRDEDLSPTYLPSPATDNNATSESPKKKVKFSPDTHIFS